MAPPATFSCDVASGDLLRVVGGSSGGGIIARMGQDKTSMEINDRLATGSLVRVAACEAGRIHYELVRGTGPTKGWVSLSVGGKALLQKLQEDVLADVDDESSQSGTQTPPSDEMSSFAEEDGLLWYSQRLVEARQAGKGTFLYDRTPFCKTCDEHDSEEISSGLNLADLEFEVASKTQQKNTLQRSLVRPDLAADSDDETVLLCQHCKLPLGEYGYTEDKSSNKLLHGECMAQVMLQERRKEESSRKNREMALKKSRREEYEIGWKIAAVPSNVKSAKKLDVGIIPQGMCCLIMQADDSVRVAPTFEPAGSMNLEYLSLALQVRRMCGREPLFSLDPLQQSTGPEASMQKKRFEPEWLAGTSVGEVMFQADYHLKELSMGEYDQPVVGMKSCFDYSKIEGLAQEWSAREWFVVRKAEIHMSEDGAVVPFLRMGVEAREQILTSSGLEDAALTRPDHPLVRYAEAFTHNFDLIAERKSVVFQLREVAKASVVAKFMLESGINFEDSWYSLGEAEGAACCLEVPQLWNDHCFSKIRMEDGAIIAAEKRTDEKVHGVYGGVDFGIDRFRLAAPSRVATSVVAGRAALGRPSSTLMATSQAGLAMGPSRQFTRLAAPLSARATLTAPSRLAAPLTARAGLAAPLTAAAARPATSLMATQRVSMGAPTSRLAAPLRASMAAPSRLAAPLTARAGLAAPLSAMAAARPATSLMATSRLSVGAPQARLAAPISAMTAARPASSLMATSRLSMAAPQVATARLSAGMPRGVDLNLEKFNLSAAAEPGTWAGTIEAPAGAENVTFDCQAFWQSVEDVKASVFADDDAKLFASVFDSTLSDRRADGDKFMPPATGLTYMHKLKTLVKEEVSVRQQRQEHFFSGEFATENPGALFPSSWHSSIELESGSPAGMKALSRSEFKAQEEILKEMLNSTAPAFDKCTEDGVRFLVFRFGSVEVRATEDVDGERKIGAVFCLSDSEREGPRVSDDEQVVKVTEYVERSIFGKICSRFYVVYQTAKGNNIVTEQLPDGTVAWRENPENIAARNSLARLLRSSECKDIKVSDLRCNTKSGGRASASKCKRFAQNAYHRAAVA